MKQFRVLFIMLMLVAFMTGFGKSTADLKQNSKTEFVAFDIVKEVPLQSVNVETKIVREFESTNIECSQSNFLTFNAIITDVGWRNYQGRNKVIPFKEKLIDNSNYKNKLHKVVQEHRIRDNPFDNTPTFLIKRY
jgi:hypothetical protein